MKNVIVDSVCVICGEAEETADQIFMHCLHIQCLWYLSLCIQFLSHTYTDFSSWASYLFSSIDDDFLELFRTLAQQIWFAGNEVVFHNGTFDILPTISKSVGFCFGLQHSGSRGRRWKSLPSNVYKVNTKAGFTSSGVTSFGCVVRNRKGHILLATTKHVSSNWDPTLAEIHAIK